MRRGFDLARARRELARSDPRLGAWMRRIGPIERDFSRPFDPLDALARSILYQQLSGKAAATITGRVEALMPRHGRLSAAGFAAIEDAALRTAGVSRQKIAALRDLTAKSLDGVVPNARKLATLDNETIIEQLTQVRGIGRWTVEMLLMSRLGRPDILPVDDLGIRKGAQRVLELDALPTPKALVAHGEAWAPWRTLASFYLWRVVDFIEPAATPVRRSQD
ncbi:MAG TPA: DNA-3-methyladenine glycosylase 2 family protein [Rhodanobacteraceae bacterium]|nr:DNA-3-methyladenine glycosylase 2 family protein [Rhodanobacteraceae bacterium]